MIGFFKALFDFSFTQFVTTRLIRLLYGIGVLVGAVTALVAISRGFDSEFQCG